MTTHARPHPERRSLVTRLAARLLTVPDGMHRRIGGREPVVVDGRVLNRRIQTMLKIGARALKPPGSVDVATMRVQMRQLAGVGMPVRTNVHVNDRRIPGPHGPIPIRLYRPFGAADLLPVILYYHGGGWVTGDLDTHDGSCRLIADESGCAVIAVDYRMAPEDPFPAGVDDAIAAYAWVHENAFELAVDATRMGVMGDSAGGNLSAVVAQQVLSMTIAPPIAQGLVYPATDMRYGGGSYESLGSGFGLTAEQMVWFRARYALPAEWEDVRMSPALADDLSGLAPALIITAGFDPLRDDGRAYADALTKAGVPVVYRCYDDMIHGFFGMGVLPEAYAAAVEICRSMGRLMGNDI